MRKPQKWLTPEQAKQLGIDPLPTPPGRTKARYRITQEEFDSLEVTTVSKSTTPANEYTEEPFFLSAYCKETDSILSIEDFCEKYNQDFDSVSSFKFLPYHYKEPSYNIVCKPQMIDSQVKEFDFDSIISKHLNNVVPIKHKRIIKSFNKDFDTLTYTDVHIGMETDSTNNAMYAVKWDKEAIIAAAVEMINTTIEEQESNTLVVDELGDFLDGFDGYTTRGGHKLPQNMTNEEAFDCALEFKMLVLDGLIPYYDSILFNNICNDNHAGSFGYFANSSFKQIAELKYDNVKVVNHRQFMNHYYMKDACYVICHGKDDSSLKFGFKPFLDSKGIEKIDQYCKQNDIYRNCKKVIFKKGDTHLALFDMCTSDDFYYFNYHALSPSSQWVQTNFKKGRRGFVNESSKNGKIYLKPLFK